MNSREDILARVRANLGVKAGDESRRESARATLAARQCGPRPGVGEDLAARFTAKSAARSSTVVTVTDIGVVPVDVTRDL
ncbi:MAG: lactate utilization protein C, partial [Flavobacteriales bacterium]